MKIEHMTELLRRAQEEEFGLVIGTNNPSALQVNMINLARELEITNLTICIPAEEQTVFIVKKSVELA